MSLMLIACWTVLTKLPNVIGNLQLVEPLLYLLDCHLNIEMNTYSTSVSKFEDLLP